jgi:hypothetical protein
VQNLIIVNVMKFFLTFTCIHPRGAVVRAEAQRSGDPCIPGSNTTVGRGCSRCSTKKC